MVRPCLQFALLMVLAVPVHAQLSDLERLADAQARLRTQTRELESRLEVFVEGLQEAEPDTAASLLETWQLLRELLITKRMQRIEALLQQGQAFEAEQAVSEVIVGLQALLDFLCSLEQGLSEAALDDARLQVLETLCEELSQRQRTLIVQSRRAGAEQLARLAAEQQRLAEEARLVGRKPSMQARLRDLADQLRTAGRCMHEAAGELAAARLVSARGIQKEALEQLTVLREALRSERAARRHARRFAQLSDLQATLVDRAGRLRSCAQRALEERATLAARGPGYRRHFGLKTALLAEELVGERGHLLELQAAFEHRGALVYTWLVQRLLLRVCQAGELLASGSLEERCAEACLLHLEGAARLLDRLAGALAVERGRLQPARGQS